MSDTDHRTADQHILVRTERSREDDGLNSIQGGIVLESLSILVSQVALRLTGNDLLANGSNSATGISLSVRRGGTTFAGGKITSSYPCRAQLVESTRMETGVGSHPSLLCASQLATYTCFRIEKARCRHPCSNGKCTREAGSLVLRAIFPDQYEPFRAIKPS